MVVVLLQSAAGDDVVVEVGEHEGQVLEQPVHEAREVLGGVAQTERHTKVLKQAKQGYNRRFRNVLAPWGAIGI